MIESIRAIGEVLLSSGAEFPIHPLRARGNLAKVIFNLDERKLDCDCHFTCDEKRAEEFLWVGNSRGQEPQLVLTTDNPEYLLSPRRGHKWSIRKISEEADKRGLLHDDDIRSLCRLLMEVEEFFADQADLVPKLEEICRRKGIRLRDISLYTASVVKNGRIIDLVKEPGYVKLLRFALYAKETEEYPMILSRCHICGEEKKVLTNPDYPKGKILCIYNIDKIGFLSGIDKTPDSLSRTHTICVDCKVKLVLGLNYVERRLATSINVGSAGKLNVFMIPAIFGMRVDRNLLEQLASAVSSAFGVVKTFKSIEEVEDVLQQLQQYRNVPFTYSINILFGRPMMSHFAYQALIQNVPVTRLIEIANKNRNLACAISDLFKEQPSKWSVGFQDLSFIFPLRRVRRGGRMEPEWKPLVELYIAMLDGRYYPKERILNKALQYARINRHGTYEGYSIPEALEGRRDEQICRGLIKFNMLLRLLREIGVVETDEYEAPSVKYTIDKDVEEFIKIQRYQEWQKALFLLGVLVGKVGIEQYKKGDEKKSILEKVDFDGMSVEKVKRLANAIVEGLRNYRILKFNEGLYGYMKELLDRSIEKLINPVDNTFYVLSGYAFVTLQAITSGGGEI